ncbi:MAG: UDP-N-acetylmuramoyl-tripeptide--D-alanyl-D-alanine ligase [candidate division KSB1 bacterium]|nr:UDP-N-acetylmuramoyl-tripeptide--D-alanyl-D-alanine ligase [candidate division KSB1 bacterium]
MKLNLNDILAIPELDAEWRGESPPDREPVSGWSTDSRRINAGQVFVALTGDKFDGHDFVKTAFENGARAAVVSRDWCGSEAAHYPLIAVKDTLTAYQEIARHWRNRFNGTLVALTGSSGKTTTKEMIYSVLSQKYNVLRNIKSYNNHVGVPATLLELRDEHEIAVIEMGTSNFGEIERLSYLARPDICVLLNIGFAHLENLKSPEGVKQAKLEICSHANPDGSVIFNADDPRLSGEVYSLKMQAGFGVGAGKDYAAQHLKCDRKGRYSFRFMGAQIHLPLPGRHNVYNALAAAVTGVRFTLPVSDIKAGLETLPQVQDRMQVNWTNRGIIMNDVYNSNPGSCLAAMRTAADIKIPKTGRRLAVLADMLELGSYSKSEHEALTVRAIENAFDELFLYGEETKHTHRAAKSAGIVSRHFASRDDLINALLKAIRREDLILVKGSRSLHMEHVIEALKP